MVKKVKIFPSLIIILLVIILNIECSKTNKEELYVNNAEFKKTTAESWNELSKKRIYFGHQSVGFNIIEGIEDIKSRYPEIRMNIVDLNSGSFQASGFFHSTIGHNKDPNLKMSEFAMNISKMGENQLDIAMLKFCYQDISFDTDVNVVFNMYKKIMAEISADNPKMKIIHFTVPLKKMQTGPKAWIKKFLNKPIVGIEDNVKRIEYNNLIKKYYSGKDPIFDIAGIESTYPDGRRMFIDISGKKVYSLIPEYTLDDGHLNQFGRKIAAERLLMLIESVLKKSE